jgi:hypothetical protein
MTAEMLMLFVLMHPWITGFLVLLASPFLAIAGMYGLGGFIHFLNFLTGGR